MKYFSVPFHYPLTVIFVRANPANQFGPTTSWFHYSTSKHSQLTTSWPTSSWLHTKEYYALTLYWLRFAFSRDMSLYCLFVSTWSVFSMSVFSRIVSCLFVCIMSFVCFQRRHQPLEAECAVKPEASHRKLSRDDVTDAENNSPHLSPLGECHVTSGVLS